MRVSRFSHFTSIRDFKSIFILCSFLFYPVLSKIARSALSLTVLDGKLYAMGGFDGQSFTTVSEIYDPAMDRWEEGTPLTSGRSGHAAAVIYQPSCASVYMDCFGEPMDKNKEQPDDDENTRNGPSTSKNDALPSTSTIALQSFSGNRCNNCDDNQQSAVFDGDVEQIAHVKHPLNYGPSASINANDQTNHEQNREVCSFLQVDCHENRAIEERRYNVTSSAISEPATSINSEVSTKLHSGIETRPTWNPKQYRRRESESDHSEDDAGVFDSDSNSNSNSRDSIKSNGSMKDLQNRRKAKNKHNCSLSKLSRTFRQNFNDFMAASSSSTAPPVTSTPFVTNLTRTRSSRGNLDERKCTLLKKYYKCKLKPRYV